MATQIHIPWNKDGVIEKSLFRYPTYGVSESLRAR